MKKGFTLILVLILCAVSGACAEKGLVAAFPEEAGESSIAQMVADTLELPLLESAEDTGSAANLMLGDPECILIGTQNILITGLQGYTERDLRQAMTPVCTLAVSPLFLVMDRDVAEELGIIGFDSFRSYISEEQDDCCFARHLDADPVDRAVTRLAYELDVLTDLFPEDEVPDALRDGDALAGVLSGADMAGTCGENLTWSLSEDGVLTVTGTGAMTDFAPGEAPWAAHTETIRKVAVQSGATRIGSYAFAGCVALSSVNLTDSVEEIGRNAFQDCEVLYWIWLGRGLEKIDTQAFDGCESLPEVKLPEGLTYIGSNAFQDCYGLKSVTIPGSVKNDFRSAFSWCADLESVTLGEGITQIGQNAFYSCVSLKEVKLPSTLKTIGSGAFSKTALETVSLPEGLETLGTSTFAECGALSWLTVPGTVTQIGKDCFMGCGKLAQVFFGGGQSQWEKLIPGTGLEGTKPQAPVEDTAGDADGDGTLTYNDALLVLRSSIGLETLTKETETACDLDGDGKLTYNDALLILRKSIGMK